MYTSPLYMGSNTTCRLTDFQSLCVRLHYIWHFNEWVLIGVQQLIKVKDVWDTKIKVPVHWQFACVDSI